MICHGNGDDHCCTLNGETCEFLAEVHPATGRRWACSLYVQHGTWERVYLDPRYIDRVRPKLRAAGIQVDCGDWPQKVPELERQVRSGDVDPCAACCWGESWRP